MASKRELIKEFGPKIIEIYGEDELKFLRENFSGEELEKYIKQDHDSFKGMRNGGKVAKKEKQKGGKIDISPKFIGLKKIRNKVKELDKRISGADSPINKSKLSKERDKAIGRIDNRLKMKNFGFGAKAGVTRKRNEFLKTGKMPKTVSGSIVGFTKKLGGIKGMSAGGNADIDLLMKGNRSDVAAGRTKKNLRSELDEKIKKLREKFKGRGTSGDAEFRKQKSALEEKFDKKYFSDMKMATKYGKDAYKSQAFGTSPDSPKRKKKPVPLNVKLMKERGFSKDTADLIKESDDYVKSVDFKVARSKLARKNKAKAEAEKNKKKKITKTKAMRGGGLVRSGSGSLSGYKVR